MITVRAYAKINWTLRVLGRRTDGYHELDTVFQSISLHDTLTIERADDFECRCDDPSVPADDRNLALRAARAVSPSPVRVTIRKRIPSGGGLGGGSSDAGAVLRALGESIDPARLHEIALSIGSDVPFFLVGGRARGTGRGEILTPLDDEAPVPLLLLFPEERIATAAVFREYRGERAEVNDLEPVVFARYPQLSRWKAALTDLGATRAFMTGSGSTIVGAFRDRASRSAAARELQEAVEVATSETITRDQALGRRPAADPA